MTEKKPDVSPNIDINNNYGGVTTGNASQSSGPPKVKRWSHLFSKTKYFLYKRFEFDRAGEAAVKRSIKRWHKGGWLNHALARHQWNVIRKKYSCDIFPGITVGEGLRIEHPMWTCIGKTTILGNNVRIYNNVLIIAKVTGDEQRIAKAERRHAKIGNDVVLGSGCTIIGPICIGDDCIIGARAIVTHDVPPHSVVIGTNQIRLKRENEKAPTYSKD